MKYNIIYKNIIFFTIFSLINGREQFDNEDPLNSKTVMTNTNDGSKVLLDKTIPTLEVVELRLNNKNSNYASIGDELIIKAIASEGIVSKEILVNGQALNYIDLTEKQFYASYFFKEKDTNIEMAQQDILKEAALLFLNTVLHDANPVTGEVFDQSSIWAHPQIKNDIRKYLDEFRVGIKKK